MECLGHWRIVGIALNVSDTSFDDIHDIFERDFSRRLGQLIATGSTASARHQARTLQLQQDLDEKAGRNPMIVRDISDANRLTLLMAKCEFQDSNASVFSFGR